jgi:hypothetical protein
MFGLSQQMFVWVHSIKFKLNPSNGSHAHTCGQTDGLEESNRLFSRLCKCAWRSLSNKMRLNELQ